MTHALDLLMNDYSEEKQLKDALNDDVIVKSLEFEYFY
jgi:hypothetical protein